MHRGPMETRDVCVAADLLNHSVASSHYAGAEEMSPLQWWALP